MFDSFHKQTTLPDIRVSDSGTRDSRSIAHPQKIGPYKIESLLNKGGMSLVYLGVHPQTTQAIVVKVLLPKYLKNKEIVSRFLKEAQIVALTNHPNIIKLYGQGEWEKGLYIAMEFIQGISLRQFIQQKSLSQKRALQIILQVAYALAHLHSHGVIHRDLKPENILITETGEIKVIDFGIAQLQGEREDTKSGKWMGTPVYMSPEQKQNPSRVTFASDIYSLGIIAYELILGRLSHGVIHPALLPKPLRKIIETSLKTETQERYKDIIDFITDISQTIKAISEQKEEKEIEQSEEILDLVEYARTLLIPKKSPPWPEVDLGIAVHEGISLSGLYLDFFRLPENRLCVILAEPAETGISSLLSASVFRGLVRMAVALFFQQGKKEAHPIQMLNALNRTLCDDPIDQKFGLCLLMLNPEKDLLSFISCNYTNLWHIPKGAKEARNLATPNPALGLNASASFLETADNWNSGDALILHSQGIAPTKKEEISRHWISDSLPLSPQPQAEKILQRLASEQSALAKQASAVLSIKRIYRPNASANSW